MTVPGPLTPFYDGSPAASATILNTDLDALLGMTGVIIQTNTGIAGGTGVIQQMAGAPIGWMSGTNLTLHAFGSIGIDDSIIAMGAGSVISLISDTGNIVFTSSPGVEASVRTAGSQTAGVPAIIVQALNGSLNLNSALDTESKIRTDDMASAGDIHIAARSIDFIAGPAMTMNSTAGVQHARGDLYLSISGPINLTSADAAAGFEANANLVAGVGPAMAPVGGDIYFTADSLDFNSTAAMSGGLSAASITAYGLPGGGFGNISGTVAGDVLFQSGFPVANGSGISCLFDGDINLAIGGNATFVSSPGPSIIFCGTGVRTLFPASGTRNINVAIAGILVAISGGGMDSGAGFQAVGDIDVAVGGAAVFQTTNGDAGSLSGVALASENGSIRFAAAEASFLGNSATPLFSQVTAPGDVAIATQGDLSFDFAEVNSGVGAVSLASLSSIFMSNGTDLHAAGQLLAIADRNIEMRSSIADSTSDRIVFVVDNAFPSRPLIGPGAFISNPSVLTAPFGVSLYTARQGQNSIVDTTFNGFSFLPGTLFIDTAQEMWCIYYPGGTTTFPFTIFYKDCVNIIAQNAAYVVDEFLEGMHPYNEFPGWTERFWLDAQNEGGKQFYSIDRRHLKFINQPKSWTVLLHED